MQRRMMQFFNFFHYLQGGARLQPRKTNRHQVSIKVIVFAVYYQLLTVFKKTPSFYCFFSMSFTWLSIVPSFKTLLVIHHFQGIYPKGGIYYNFSIKRSTNKFPVSKKIIIIIKLFVFKQVVAVSTSAILHFDLSANLGMGKKPGTVRTNRTTEKYMRLSFYVKTFLTHQWA